MSLTHTYSFAMLGLDAPSVCIETHISNGLPGLSMVGLAEITVREAKDRVRSAMINSGFDFPQRRVTINLAPADLPKEGSRFDLAIALGILSASKQLPNDACKGYTTLGELALDGVLRPVKGVLGAALASRRQGQTLIVPLANQAEAALAGGNCLAAKSLIDVCAHLRGEFGLPNCQAAPYLPSPDTIDMSDVIGQASAKRGCEIAAAGGHNLLLFGAPGTGKSLLAQRFKTIMPPLTRNETLEVAAIYSLLGLSFTFGERPFHAPHHSASATALSGGGSDPKPGAITLAHHGVLFLDELPEFQRHSIEMLREPLETGEVVIARAKRIIRYPANFQLISAMNPCPCGYFGTSTNKALPRCKCSLDSIQRYRSKISGPLLDRIDLHVGMDGITPDLFSEHTQEESSQDIRARIIQARERQLARQQCQNSQLNPNQLKEMLRKRRDIIDLLNQAMQNLKLSPRSAHRSLRVALSCADLAMRDLNINDVREALSLRQFDRSS